jgi:hypothetical protein
MHLAILFYLKKKSSSSSSSFFPLSSGDWKPLQNIPFLIFKIGFLDLFIFPFWRNFASKRKKKTLHSLDPSHTGRRQKNHTYKYTYEYRINVNTAYFGTCVHGNKSMCRVVPSGHIATATKPVFATGQISPKTEIKIWKIQKMKWFWRGFQSPEVRGK